MTQELIEKRQENSKQFSLDSKRRQLRVSIGAIHYKDNYADDKEMWKDIDLTWEDKKIARAPYELAVDDYKLTIRNKKTGKVSTIEIDTIAGKKLATPIWQFSEGLARVSNIALDTDLEIVAEFGAVRFTRILKSNKAPIEAKFKVAGDFVVRASDADGEIPVESTLVDGILTETLGLADRPIKYPVRIDPTYQVGTGADDGVWYLTTFNNSADQTYLGNAGASMTSYWRFTLVDIPQGSTIDTAYLIFRSKGDNGGTTCNVLLDANDADTAVAPTSAADGNGKDRTTENAPWNSIPAWSYLEVVNSPSIVSPVQEVINRPGWVALNALMIFAWNNGSDNLAYRQSESYEETTVYCPQLVVTFSPPFSGRGWAQK